VYVKKRPPEGGLFYITKPFYEGHEVNGFHETDTWSRSFNVMYNKKIRKRNLRSLVRRRNHYTEGLYK